METVTVNPLIQLSNECMKIKPSLQCSTSSQLVWWKNLKNEREKSESVTKILGQN